MSMTVTATQGGAISSGTAISVQVLTGAKVPALQNGAAAGTQSSTPNLNITPTANNSLLFSALLSLNTSPTAESGESAVYTSNNAPLYFSFYQSSATTSAGNTLLMGSSTGTGVAICNVEILANTGTSVTLWNSQPGGNSTGGSVATSPAFTPPPNALLVAMVTSNGSAGTTTVTISDTLGLAWTCLQQENGGGNGYVGIWIAQVPDPFPTILYVSDVSVHGSTTNSQAIGYNPQSQKSLILCCGSLYSSDASVQSITSISDNAGNTWHYASTANQTPPYAGHTVSGQYYNAFIGWTWQDKGAASTYNINFSGSAFVNADISEWSGVGSITGAAAAGFANTSTMTGPTAPVTFGSIGVEVTNTLGGSLAGATSTGTDGTAAISMPGENVNNFLISSGNQAGTNPLQQANSPYGFTFANFGSGQDYATALVILNQRGAPTGGMFRLIGPAGLS